MKNIKEISGELLNCELCNIEEVIKNYENDTRKGVITAIEKARKRIVKAEEEEKRLDEITKYECEFTNKGYKLIAGMDEVGRGPLAGPVVVASVILPVGCRIHYVDDSKKLNEKKRIELAKIIKNTAIAYSISVIDNEKIDEINILRATYKAMTESIENLDVRPDMILVDAVDYKLTNIPQKGIIKGDSKSISIAAASIIAKVYRDDLMKEYSKKYPEYGFESNKGYGSATHVTAIQNHGLTPIHRKSFVGKILDDGYMNNTVKGAIGENIAVKEIIKRGYEVLDRNYRYGNGEIDIVGKKDGYICFIEVKYRTNTKYGEPCEAVTTTKQTRIIEASQGYIMENINDIGSMGYRYDMAEILIKEGKKYFRYTENAFGEER